MSERRGFRRGARTRILRDVEAWETSIPVHSTAAFSDAGEIFVNGERITYKSRTATSFDEVERGASRGAGGSEPRFIPGGTDVTQSNPGDYTVSEEGLQISSRPNLNLSGGNGLIVSVTDDPAAEATNILLTPPRDGLILLDDPKIFTNVASVSLDGYFTAEHRYYRILIAGTITAVNNALLFRFMNASGPIATNNYYGALMTGNAWGSIVAASAYPNVGVSYIMMGYQSAGSTHLPFFYEIDIIPEHIANYSQMRFSGWVNRSGLDVMTVSGSGQCSGTGPKTGVQFITGLSAPNLSGIAHIYGYGGA